MPRVMEEEVLPDGREGGGRRRWKGDEERGVGRRVWYGQCVGFREEGR